MTHKELVQVAYKWLLKNGGVGFAFKELYSTAAEIPDVIGFDSWKSVVIEVKVSRSDFLNDKKKKHRAKGMGNYRLFCCPTGLIKMEELPDKWGLIYVNEKGKTTCIKNPMKCRVYDTENRKLVDTHLFECDTRAERCIMYTALRRMAIKGHLKSIYDKNYEKITPADIIERNTI